MHCTLVIRNFISSSGINVHLMTIYMYSSQIFKQMHKIYQRLGIPDYLVIHDYTACGVVTLDALIIRSP